MSFWLCGQIRFLNHYCEDFSPCQMVHSIGVELRFEREKVKYTDEGHGWKAKVKA